MKGTPRIVLLTGGHPHGIRILKGLAGKQIDVTAVVHETEVNPHWAAMRAGNLGKRAVTFAKGTYRWSNKILQSRDMHRTYGPLAKRVVITGANNSPRMRADLEALEPDYILLGGIGIIKQEIIDTARRGVVNAHPGLLPWIRGTGVVGAALKRGIPVGASCHWVNSGIDCGDIISRRLLPITGAEADLREIEVAANLLISDMMVHFVSDYLVPGEQPEAAAQMRRFPICQWLAPDERAAIDNEIRSGLAKRLFEKWRDRCLDQEFYHLPAQLDLAES